MINRFVAAIALLGSVGTASAIPMDFSFTGTFAADDDVQIFNFTANGSSTVTLRSYSYAGGTQADGNVVSAGGFDPVLALFNSAGNLVQQYDDGPDAVPSDPVTGAQYDTNLSLVLVAGDYTVAIMQYSNFFAGSVGQNISLGFTQAGNPTFTSLYRCSNGQFCDVYADNRRNAWAFDVLNVESAEAVTVPEPASLALLGIGLAGLGAIRRRKA